MTGVYIRIVVLGGLLAALVPAVHASHGDSISASALASRLADGQAPLILDVRSEREYESGHVPGATHIPYKELPARLSDLSADKNEEVVVYCEVGGRAQVAADTLEGAGYTEVHLLEGHMRHWRSTNYPKE